MISPIQTRRHWRIRRVASEPRENPVEQSGYEAKIHLNQDKMDEGWWVSHKVAFGGRPPEESTHDCEIEFEGIFDVHPDFPADRIEDLVRTNGGAILYSAVRGWVMNLSARSKHGPFEMPTIDARSFIKKSPDRLEGISRE